MLTSSLFNLTDRVAGNPGLPLRQRMFNVFCILGVFITLVMGGINLAIGKYLSASISATAIFIFSLGYYISYSKDKHDTAAPVVFGALMALLAINFFFLGGCQGPSYVLFMGIFVAKMLLSPPQHYLAWTIANISIVGLLLFMEWLYPEWVIPFGSSSIGDMINFYVKYVFICLSIVLGIVIFLTDYERNTNRILRQKDMLDALNEEKIRLISIITHDMRAPMAGIMTYLDAIVHLEFPLEERKKIESSLLTLSKSTLSMLERVLTNAKDFYNLKDVQLSDVDLEMIVQENLSLYYPLALKKPVSLDFKITNSGRTVIRGNDGMLHLVLRNLLDNALKFTQANGRIDILLNCGEDNTRLIVSDSGSGSNKALDTLLPKSMYIDDLIASGSLGLGLTMCKKYIQAMDGTIVCEKNEWNGTSFIIEFKH